MTDQTTTRPRRNGVAIGYRVRHADGRQGSVTTHYDNGDHMVYIDGRYERWADADCVWAGR